MSAIEIVAVAAVGGLVVALIVQAVFHERVVARLVRLAAREPIEPIERPEIPAAAPLTAPQAPRRRITIPIPGVPWRPVGALPKEPFPRKEQHEPAGQD